MGSYVIEIPEGEEARALQDLHRRGAVFTDLDEAVREVMGAGPETLARSINNYLREMGHTRLLREDGGRERPADEKLELLALAHQHFGWSGTEVDEGWFGGDGELWETILRGFPKLAEAE